MGKVIKLHAERWVERVFEEGDLRVDVSTKGNVRFTISDDVTVSASTVLTMEQMACLGQALSLAYRRDDSGNRG